MSKRFTHHALTRVLALATACFAALAAGPAVSAAEYGARAYGMAGAYTAVADDIASLLYNPAGLSEHAFEVALGVGTASLQDFQEIESIIPEDFLDRELSLNLITLGGMSVGRFGAGVAAEAHADVHGKCGDHELPCGEAEYMVQALVGAGFNVVRLPLGAAELKVGGSVARLHARRATYDSELNEDNITFTGILEDSTGEGYAVHVGAKLKLTEIVTVGVAARNLAGSVTWTGTRTEETVDVATGERTGSPKETPLPKRVEKLDPVYRAGVAIRPPILGMVLAADVASDGVVRVGVEKNLLFNLFSLRAGQIIDGDQRLTTAGLGINVGPVHFDAAVGLSEGEITTALVEGSVRF